MQISCWFSHGAAHTNETINLDLNTTQLETTNYRKSIHENKAHSKFDINMNFEYVLINADGETFIRVRNIYCLT